MHRLRLFVFSLGFALVMPAAARAQTSYQIQTIARRGDKVGSAQIKATGSFFVGSLNDSGQLVFDTESAAGGELLVQYANGTLTPVVVAGGAAPGGKWPRDILFYPPVSLNQAGSIAFAAPVQMAGGNDIGTFRLDSPSSRINVVARNSLPIGGHFVFLKGGGPSPVINNRGEITFTAVVKDAARNSAGGGIFFQGRDGGLQTVVQYNQTLPGGGVVTWASNPVVDDSGRVIFLAASLANDTGDVYAWENGTITPVLQQPVTAPAGKLMLGYVGAWPNNQNRNVLLNVHFYALARHYFSLYLSESNSPVPVAVPGQPMPGGGLYESAQVGGVSFANVRGQHAFMAVLRDGSTAAYLMDADGKLSLLLKSGTVTPLGKIVTVGEGSNVSYGTGLGEGAIGSQGIAMNSQGQVALPVKIGTGPDVLVLLTPATP